MLGCVWKTNLGHLWLSVLEKPRWVGATHEQKIITRPRHEKYRNPSRLGFQSGAFPKPLREIPAGSFPAPSCDCWNCQTLWPSTGHAPIYRTGIPFQLESICSIWNVTEWTCNQIILILVKVRIYILVYNSNGIYTVYDIFMTNYDHQIPIPNALCMEYLPTFGSFFG